MQLIILFNILQLMFSQNFTLNKIIIICSDGHHDVKTSGNISTFHQLSPLGIRNSYLLGRWIRMKYVNEIGFLQSEYSKKQVFVQSYNETQSYQTGQSIVHGIFPYYTGKQYKDQENYNSVLNPNNIMKGVDLNYFALPYGMEIMAIHQLKRNPEIQKYELKDDCLFQNRQTKCVDVGKGMIQEVQNRLSRQNKLDIIVISKYYMSELMGELGISRDELKFNDNIIIEYYKNIQNDNYSQLYLNGKQINCTFHQKIHSPFIIQHNSNHNRSNDFYLYNLIILLLFIIIIYLAKNIISIKYNNPHMAIPKT